MADGERGVGKPPVLGNPKELELKCEEYFEWIKGEFELKAGNRTIKDESGNPITEEFEYKDWIRNPEQPTVTGLALFLGFESRQSLYDYGKKTEYSYIIKRSKLKVEHNYEKGLWNDKPTGVIFALKNMGWNDTQSIDHTTNGENITTNQPLEVIIKDMSKKNDTSTD